MVRDSASMVRRGRVKEIKICKKPYIIEDTDRWGQCMGTYSVNYAVGFIGDTLWEDLHLFENYSNTPETKAEQQAASDYLANGGDTSNIPVPIMERLIKRAGGMLWQLNMRLDEPPLENGDTNYIRSFATYNVPSLYEWNKSFDEEYDRLKLQCENMNKKEK